MGKFYDAEKTNEYFEQIDTAIATYAEQANAVLSSFATFAGDDEQKGEQAEAVKELVGTGEKNLVDRMLDIQQQISEAGAHIREGFETGVDAAENARIEEDTLTQIEDSFKGFYKTYDDPGTQIEDIATILQSRYGEYATFERPDFESGREAFKDFCGGASNGGFLQECMEKLESFDAAETDYLSGLDLSGMLSELRGSVDNATSSFESLDMTNARVLKTNLNSVSIVFDDTRGNDDSENGRPSRRGAIVNDTNVIEANLDMSIPAVGERNRKCSNRDSFEIADDLGVKSGDEFDRLIEQICGMTKEEHYARNDRNDISEAKGKEWMDQVLDDEDSGWEKAKMSESIYHTKDPFNTPIDQWNIKLVNKDGREVILDPNNDYCVVTDPELMGTYNFAPLDGSPEAYYKHAIKDVIPYIAWGNSEEDMSTREERLRLTGQGFNYSLSLALESHVFVSEE